ncbi:MAG: type VI secretion system protein TssA, partial [Deltaproteobacteria bacterium]|nr:type VI secretion system protein TssA [Deltaproteobacteria bacterium]
MPSPQTIEFEALLAPIAGDNPAGESLRYEGTYDIIQEQIHEEEALEQGDWQRETKAADWRAAETTTSQALATKSKDLQLAAWLTMSLVKRHGFAGLRDGCRLLRELAEQFWDSLYPELEDGDAEFRAGPVEGLNGRLPLLIKQIPLTKSSEAVYTWLHWEEARVVDNFARQNQEEALQAALADGKVSSEQVNKAVAATPRAFYEALLEDMQQSKEECEQLDRVSDEKFGRSAPSLLDIKKTIDECLDFIKSTVKKKRAQEGIRDEAEEQATTPNGLDEGAGFQEQEMPPVGVGSGSVPFDPVNRTDALRRLEAVAAFFRRTEPHSPVSYLVQRAARWGRMPLEEWLQEVIKSEDVLGQLRETLGIKVATPST